MQAKLTRLQADWQARQVMDSTTSASTLDIHISEEHQGSAFDHQLMKSIQETVDAMPNPRLPTSGGANHSADGNNHTKVEYYDETLELNVLSAINIILCMSLK